MQEQKVICENCSEKQAVTTCEVCGAQVCTECKLEYGCKVCNGGKTSFE